MRRDAPFDLFGVLAIFADDERLKSDALVSENAASFNKDIKTFLGNQPANRQHAHRRGSWRNLILLVEQSGEVGIQTVIDAVNFCWAQLLQKFPISLRAGYDKLRRIHFAA